MMDPLEIVTNTDALGNAAGRVQDLVLKYAPSVLTGLLILVGGWIVARIVRSVLRRMLRAIKVDRALEGSRVESLIGAFGKDWTASRLVAQLAYLMLLLLTLNTLAGYWGLGALEAALASALGYLPKVLSALGVLAAGMYAAGFARRSVGALLRELRNPAAPLVEALTEGGIALVVGLVALDMLGVNLEFITSNLTLLLGALLIVVVFLSCFAMRAPAEQLVFNYYLRRLLSVGDHVSTKGHQGTVVEFVPLGLILRDPTGDEFFVPARDLIGGLKRRHGLSPDQG